VLHSTHYIYDVRSQRRKQNANNEESSVRLFRLIRIRHVINIALTT